MSDLIKCSYCNKIHDKYEDCEDKLKYKKSNSNEYNEKYNKCYNNSKWKRIRNEVLKDNDYCCEVCKQLEIVNYTDIQVHHITKIIDNDELMFDKSNLLVVCREHHRQIEGMNLNEISEFIKSKL
ncbi:HNH endonuclease signature motif containing protein [Romboutsia sedimentorum]|uniref:HNH endonuclease n=1 Tax=Romboutsia sedimentorum TaxID=1368474 RepID=UPI0024DE252E|nr:HNH endonuclease signature motif containing protein [Romboutsia sedimentorum]MDK2587485.1 HNH endonuclease signature motif containing protein [Romboutsia sedimentorum]